MSLSLKTTWPMWCALALCMLTACEKNPTFTPQSPERGPGALVGLDGELNTTSLRQGVDGVPNARNTSPPEDGAIPDCGAECVSYCDGLALGNAVNRGMCQSTWGVGLQSAPIDNTEACRRLFVDVLGVFPTKQEVDATCEGKGFGQIVASMLGDPRFVMQQRKRWSDVFGYDTESVSVERIYDMDLLVQKLYSGKVSYDTFVAVASAHPVLVRQFDTSGDRAEALFNIFMGRPPLGNERSDIARLYNLWSNGYYDHPQLGARLPDAVIRYRCLNEAGEADEQSSGACTSILYGYNPVVLKPDIRADDDGNGNKTMWSGLLKAQEWALLQKPGRLLAQDRVLWEKAVDDVLDQYIDYDIGTLVPKVRQELVQTLLDHDGDLRAVHFAVLTSAAYLQSNKVSDAYTYRWTYGPIKQIAAQPWLDTLAKTTGIELGKCDHRLNRPERLLEANTLASWALVEGSDWSIDKEGRVDTTYRDLARSLGGCPSNDVGGRFKIISILTTATQLNHVNRICDTGQSGDGVNIERLLPSGVGPNKAVSASLAQDIVAHQTRLFYGRDTTQAERDDAARHGEQCEREVCKAQDFARPACFALLSSAEMLFY